MTTAGIYDGLKDAFSGILGVLMCWYIGSKTTSRCICPATDTTTTTKPNTQVCVTLPNRTVVVLLVC